MSILLKEGSTQEVEKHSGFLRVGEELSCRTCWILARRLKAISASWLWILKLIQDDKIKKAARTLPGAE
jgi:hypothetical protein